MCRTRGAVWHLSNKSASAAVTFSSVIIRQKGSCTCHILSATDCRAPFVSLSFVAVMEAKVPCEIPARQRGHTSAAHSHLSLCFHSLWPLLRPRCSHHIILFFRSFLWSCTSAKITKICFVMSVHYLPHQKQKDVMLLHLKMLFLEMLTTHTSNQKSTSINRGLQTMPACPVTAIS